MRKGNRKQIQPQKHAPTQQRAASAPKVSAAKPAETSSKSQTATKATSTKTAAKRSAAAKEPTTAEMRAALRAPARQPQPVALPTTSLPWRAWLPVIGPVMTMLDHASDAVAAFFSLRKPPTLTQAEIEELAAGVPLAVCLAAAAFEGEHRGGCACQKDPCFIVLIHCARRAQCNDPVCAR